MQRCQYETNLYSCICSHGFCAWVGFKPKMLVILLPVHSLRNYHKLYTYLPIKAMFNPCILGWECLLGCSQVRSLPPQRWSLPDQLLLPEYWPWDLRSLQEFGQQKLISNICCSWYFLCFEFKVLIVWLKHWCEIKFLNSTTVP